LAKLKFGIIAGTPPTDLLVKHKLINQTTPFNLNDSTHFDSIARQMLQDLLDKKIDVALLWGPYAGYYIVHEHLPVKVALLQTEPNGPRLDYRIAMGVRPNEVEWRRKLNRLLLSNKDAIDKILKDYGVPMLDEQGRPVYMPAP
jgi:ABC-type amino acid transport substrate-binding protein